MKAMLLAAGLGTRLRPLTYELPKPMVPILGPAGDGAHHAAARAPRVRRRRREPALLPRPDPRHFGDGSRQGIQLVYSYEEELLGTAGGVRNVRDHFGGETFLVISGDALTDIDLTAFYERAQGGGRDRDARAEAGRRSEPAGRRDRRRRGPHPGLPGEARARRGAVQPRQLRHLHVRARDLRLLPRDASSSTGRRTSSRRCSTRTSPFYGHEIAEYWNDVGSFEEYRQGNFDALEGRVQVEMPGRANGASSRATPRSRAPCSSARAARSPRACASRAPS